MALGSYTFSCQMSCNEGHHEPRTSLYKTNQKRKLREELLYSIMHYRYGWKKLTKAKEGQKDNTNPNTIPYRQFFLSLMNYIFCFDKMFLGQKLCKTFQPTKKAETREAINRCNTPQQQISSCEQDNSTKNFLTATEIFHCIMLHKIG